MSENNEYVLDHSGEELDQAIDYFLNSKSDEDVQEIFYADFVVDLANFTITYASTTYQEIERQLEAGKYIIGRGNYALVSSPINIGFFPLSAYVPEQNLMLFSGFIQSSINNMVVVLSITLEVRSSNSANVRARIVSTTDIN